MPGSIFFARDVYSTGMRMALRIPKTLKSLRRLFMT